MHCSIARDENAARGSGERVSACIRSETIKKDSSDCDTMEN